VANEGVAFGFSVPRIVPLIFSALVIIAAGFFYYRHPLFDSRLAKIALGSIVGGSIGNLADRIYLGHVVDFIDIRLWGDYHWPAFNLADTAIVIGAILLIYFLVHSWRLQKPS
jgi:signal peptidase II